MLFEYINSSTSGALFPSRDAYQYLERGMRFVGWLPPQTKGIMYYLYMVYSVMFVFGMVVYLPIAFFGSYFIDFEAFTPGDFLTSVQVAFNAACLALKIVVLLPHMWRFEEAKNILDEMDKRCKRRQHRIRVHQCVARCNMIYMVYQMLYFSYATLTFLSSAFMGSTPWGFYVPFVDYRKSTSSLWVAATVEYIIGSAAVYSDQMIDLYPLVFALLLRVHMSLLIERIENLRTDETEPEEQSYQELVNCIKDHKRILEFCELFRPCISGTIFAQFLVIGLGLGLSMMNLLFFSNLWTGMATTVFIFVLIIETFPFCLLCELFIDDGNNMASAIFYSNWLDASKRYKSTISYFLHQSQQSISFIAGGIFPISVKTNIEMAKLAFTVVTLVKQMNIVEKLIKD